MLTISNLRRAFGPQVVFDAASWSVSEGEKIGLVGANGAGKSTLLRMLAGLEQPDDGLITMPRGSTIGYLPQEVLGISGRNVLEAALDAFADVRALEQECRRLEHELASCSPEDSRYAEIMEAYAHVRERWDHEGSYDHESQAKTVLSGLGFQVSDFERDAGEFSGGWQMRLALAKLLLRRPNFLLLDEPTNHLDIEARNWLEEFIAAYPYTVILVAHDRYFLDVTVQRITEVSRGKLIDYLMTYSQYLVEKKVRLEREIEAYREQQQEIERIQAFINRFRYQASKAPLVQSRIKQLEKMEKLAPPDGGAPAIHFRFPPCERSGRIVLELQRATKRYGDLTVYEDLDLTIERGRKVALVGVNGAGKSTLIKMLAAVEPLSSGTRRVGHNVTIGYFAQDQTQVLDPNKTVLDEITTAAPYNMVPQVRTILGAFLFSGESVYKPIKVLSGGERNRLALVKLLLRPSNCLLLDEPTNHLDITAKEVLLEALQNYTGTLVLVVHDRYILDHLPDEIIEVGSGQAVRYIGNYEDYLRKKSAEAAGTMSPLLPTRRSAVEKERAGVLAGHPEQNSRASKNAAARREKEIARIEERISEKEAALAEVESIINEPNFYNAHDNPQSILSRFAQLKKDIDSLYGRLERLESGGS